MPTYKRLLSPLLSIGLMITVADASTASADAALAENTSSESQTGQAAENEAPAATDATPTADQLYQLVAPIALFPDNLVAQVLAASTYPDQVTAAYQWLQQNSSLKGQQLMEAVNQQPWDASIKGLTQFPDVLQQMATNLSWTSALGDAYYNIPQSVMNPVQVMRQRAYQSGNLKSNRQQSVTVQNQAPGSAPSSPASSGQPQVTVVQPPPQTIVIQPAQPQVVYVPTYNPTAVYGAPVPVYPGYSTGAMVATGLISFGVGVAVGAAVSGGGCCGWGWNSWGCGWHNSTVVYNRNVYVSNSNTFVNRNNYYNRNNVNVNNVNRNNVNVNNVNRNNINANNRANNFSNYSTPHFNQSYNQPQYRNTNPGNLDQQNRPAAGQNQARPANFNQNQRSAERGYGHPTNARAGNSAFGNYGEGDNARTNSARGQQSPAGGHGGCGARRRG